MNLIKILGGYEDAKKFANDEHSDGFDMQVLNRELLEYRRQHNIFEIGDKVIHIDDPEKQILMTVFDENKLEVWVDDGCRITRCNLRHATDAEIKAGKRL